MRKNFKEAQSLVEYLIIGVAVIGIVFFSLTILFQSLSDSVVNSAPVYSEKTCMQLFSNLVSKDDNSYISDETALNIVKSTGNTRGRATKINNVIPVECADKIDFPISNYDCSFNISKRTCEIDCTIYTSSNEILDEIRVLVEAGTINPNLLAKAQDIPFNEIPSGTIQDVFEEYYFVGTETRDPYLNFKYSVSLMEYLNNENLLPVDLKDLYDQLLLNIKNSTTCKLIQESEQTTLTYKTWETSPVHIGEEAPPSIQVPVISVPDPPGSEEPPKPKYKFCSHKNK